MTHIAADLTGGPLTAERLTGLRYEFTEMRDQMRASVAATVAEIARGGRDIDASPALVALRGRIERGELTWERVAAGDAELLGDLFGEPQPGLPALFTRMQDLVEAGFDPDESLRRARAEFGA